MTDEPTDKGREDKSQRETAITPDESIDQGDEAESKTKAMDDPGKDESPASKNSEFDLDLDRLRISQDFASTVGVKKLLTTVPVRKPNRQEFIRVHPSNAYRLQTFLLELKEEREIYLVGPQVWSGFLEELTPKTLFTTMNRQGVLTVWPIKLPGEDGRLDTWNESALIAAEKAMKGWVRVASNPHLGAYEVFLAPGDFPEPEWPELSFREILNIAFRGRYIESVDHPVIRRLRGEI